MTPFANLPVPVLKDLAEALDEGRLTSSLEAKTVGALVSSTMATDVKAELKAYLDLGFGQKPLAMLLRVIAAEREAQQRVRDRVSWVWSGPSDAKFPSRDTSVVVQELFKRARRSVLLMTYAFDKGEKSRRVFEVLADRMAESPELEVAFCANLQPLQEKAEKTEDAIARFKAQFIAEVWPWAKLPPVYYDPRSLTQQGKDRASLHAKILVVDNEVALVTSANFTEAAHERNFEAGVLVGDPETVTELAEQVLRLIGSGVLKRCF